MKPDSPPQFRPPSRLATLLEMRAPLDGLLLALRLPQLLNAPRGDGRPVALLPGFRADELSMWPMKRFLRRLGYDVYDWGLGRNQGNVDRLTVRMRDRVHEIANQRDGDPVTLIGWSLGGTVAREVARFEPQAVREVITLGSPIIGGPKYTAVGFQFADRVDLDAFEQEVHRRNRLGLTQPVTSIYSKLDGVVGWQASVDIYNPQARNIEVYSSHFGLGINANVWRLIADILAEDRGA
jgi:pimeloyl-ACP methyl ester carboxylesterase